MRWIWISETTTGSVAQELKNCVRKAPIKASLVSRIKRFFEFTDFLSERRLRGNERLSTPVSFNECSVERIIQGFENLVGFFRGFDGFDGPVPLIARKRGFCFGSEGGVSVVGKSSEEPENHDSNRDQNIGLGS